MADDEVPTAGPAPVGAHDPADPPRPARRRLVRIAAGTVLVGAVVVAGLTARSYVRAGQALRRGADEALAAERMLRSDPGHLDQARLDQVQAMLDRAGADVGPRSARLRDGTVAGMARHLPLIGGPAREVVAMRDLGLRGVDLARLAMPVARASVTKGQPILERIVPALPPDRIDRASADVAAISADYAAIARGPALAWQFRSARSTLLVKAKPIVTAGPNAVAGLRVLATAAGPGAHRYLILLGNPAEERPGGGFIGVVGEIVVDDGRIVSKKFRDSFFADKLVAYRRAPEALDTYMFRGAPWGLSDSNWSPDFPTSAAQAAAFYTEATHETLDGVVAVDPEAFGYILGVTGPVSVPPYPQVVTADNALVELNLIANKVRPGDPGKVFLSAMGDVMLGRLTALPQSSANAMVSALTRAVREKHVSIAFTDPALEQTVADHVIGGRLGDGLLVDDANLSASKGDLWVTRHFTLKSDQVPGATELHLHLDYTNPPTRDPVLAPLDSALSHGEYRDYLRVYLPAGAVVVRTGETIGTNPTIDFAGYGSELGSPYVAWYLALPKGQSATFDLDVRLPGPPRAVRWQNQLASLIWPVHIEVRHGSATTTADTVLDRDLTVPAPS